MQKSIFYSIVYLIFSIVPFLFLAYPSLLGEINIQAYSDALTYERLAKEDFGEFISISFNLVGPIYILKLLDYNYFLIYIFNLIVFLISIKVLFTYYNINYKYFLFFIFINPMVLFALFSVNKEILLLFNVVLILVYLKNKSLSLLLITIVFGYIIKWQMSFFIILLACFFFIDKFYKNRFAVIVSFLIIISVVFPMMSDTFEHVMEVSNLDTDKVQGSGVFPALLKLQSSIGGYVIAFIPKLLQLLFGLLGRFYLLSDWSDFWNNFVQTIYSFTFLLLTLFSIYKKKFNLNNNIFYTSLIFSIIFALTPIFSVRYFFPLYIFLAVLVSQKSQKEGLE